MTFGKLALSGTLALCAGTLAFAQADSFSAKDKMFLKMSAQADMAEMKLAQLALQKSSNDDIKSYANQMMTDHQKLTDSAKPVAEKAGMTPPTDVNPTQKAEYARLEKMSGTQFDKLYTQDAVADHNKVLRAVKSENASTQNSDMKTLTSTAEPIVADHEEKATDLAKKMGIGLNKLPSDKS